jgi:hypothetical protein
MSQNEPSQPPSNEVDWKAVSGDRTTTVRAWRWFEARELAMRHFGCGPDAVVVERAK